MTLEEELIVHLNNDEEFLIKLQQANLFFKSSELPVQCKVTIIKWVLAIDIDDNIFWNTIHSWLSSSNFKDISRNEIDTKDVKSIIESMVLKINAKDNSLHAELICKVTNAVFTNKIFEQYFKIDTELYLKLISSVLLIVDNANIILDFLKPNLFYQNLLHTESFNTNFINIIIPVLVQVIIKFNDDKVFVQVSRIVQKCIFNNKQKSFEEFINQIFINEKVDKCEFKVVLKSLSEAFDVSKNIEFLFKLCFYACASSYENNSLLVLKYFIVLTHLVGFRHEAIPLSNKFLTKLSKTQPTKKSHKTILELIDVLDKIKIDTNCLVNDVNIQKLLKGILIDYIISSKKSKINFQVIKRVIQFDPSISQEIIEQILNYCLSRNNNDLEEEYEELILVILDTFSKLHRVENFISKLVIVLDSLFLNKSEKDSDFENIAVTNLLTPNILQSFSKNIQSLASWQIINVFKTFYHSLNRLIKNNNTVENENILYFLHMEILSELIGVFLSSIRVAEHTVASNVVEKTKNCLKDFEELLHLFGKSLLNKKHNCRLMRSFLNIAFYWAELGIILRYYTVSNNDFNDLNKKSIEYNFAACNIVYLHPYLSVEEWCLISERITNFGELACRHLLHKLFVQKVRALFLFEQKINDEILLDLARNLTSDIDSNWKDILQNKFLTNILVPTLDLNVINKIVEKLILFIDDFENLIQYAHVFNSTSVINAVVYAAINKCDKLISKRKRKHDEDSAPIKLNSSKICQTIQIDQFQKQDFSVDIVNTMKKIYENNNNEKIEMKFSDDKVIKTLDVLKKFPVIFCNEHIQNFFLLYMFSLHKDLTHEFSNGQYKDLRKSIEVLILGSLQQYKYKLSNIFSMVSLSKDILNNFDEWQEAFGLVIDNIFKNKDSIVEYESLVSYISEKLNSPIYMQCGMIIIDTVNKLKKVKMPKETKTVAEGYKLTICGKITEISLKNKPNEYILPGYSYALKTYYSQNNEEQISKLLGVLNNFTNFALDPKNDLNKNGYLLLFNTVLQNRLKIRDFDDELPIKIWNVCTQNKNLCERLDEYSQLILSITCYIDNEKFGLLIRNLNSLSNECLKEGNYKQFGFLLKTWESIFTADVNPVKSKNLQVEILQLLSNILIALQSSKGNEEFYENVFNFYTLLVKTIHFHLTSSITDLLILNITILIEKDNVDFQLLFNLAVSLMSNLLKYRKSLIMDRLPPYLQQFRGLLKHICKKANVDVTTDECTVRKLADCAYQLEKLTKSLVVHQKDMSRIAMYLVADILEQYEKITVPPNVKMHLNNCIYSLITICDQHAVSYLMRVLSSASTEMFKIMYDNYKKYYRFTGKA